MQTVMLWISGLSGSQLRRSLQRQTEASPGPGGRGGDSWQVPSLCDSQQRPSSSGIVNVPGLSGGFAASLLQPPKLVVIVHDSMNILKTTEL